MKIFTLLPGFILATSMAHAQPIKIGSAIFSGVVPVANADHPYSNVDHNNDAGNDTGDSQVERLNSAQLDEIRPQAPYEYYGSPPMVYAPPVYEPGYSPGYPPPGYEYNPYIGR